jgi:hypothetical protein
MRHAALGRAGEAAFPLGGDEDWDVVEERRLCAGVPTANMGATDMAKRAELKPGDEVSWKTTQGETQGTVEKKLTSTARVKGHVAKASKDDPQYLVKSAKSGKEAIHKPDALRKG